MTEIQFGVMLIFNVPGQHHPAGRLGSVRRLRYRSCLHRAGHVQADPYFVALVAALLAVTYIPALSLGLPSLMGLI